MSEPALLAIGGPTAAGKTDLAIAIARSFGGEIVNADSRQVYRGMNIGTAKPTAAQRTVVPHHLLDIAAPDEDYTLALYARQAHDAIARIACRGSLPILVGGTGLYLRAVAQGYSVPAVPPDPLRRRALEHMAEEHGAEALLKRLRVLDPEGAAVIDTKNVRRVIRAIEVSEALGVPFSSLQLRTTPYNVLMLILEGDRTSLFARADARLDAMIESGFADEVASLLGSGIGPDLPSMSALGYREFARHLTGELTFGEALETTRTSTRAFIRRQTTWFRREVECHRISIDVPGSEGMALTLTESWLRSARQ